MTSIPSVRFDRACSYGGIELRNMAHRYWLVAFGISVTIHLAIILFSSIGSVLNPAIVPPRVPVDGPRVIDWNPQGIPWTPPLASSGVRHRIPFSRHATPVPVPEAPLAPERPLPVGGDPAGIGTPGTVGIAGTGGVGGEGGIDDEEVPPPPFRAVEKVPAVIRSQPPSYPAMAAKAGLEGRVIVSIWVDRQGKPRQVAIANSTNEAFNEAALEAARKYLFTPAYMTNGPVSVWVSIAFTFRLRGK
jgi:TonB family protein